MIELGNIWKTSQNQVSIKMNTTTWRTQPLIVNAMINNLLLLPKITTPQFSVYYLKWIQFYELFSEMVGKQPLLGTQDQPEASDVITHLCLTKENYTTV